MKHISLLLAPVVLAGMMAPAAAQRVATPEIRSNNDIWLGSAGKFGTLRSGGRIDLTPESVTTNSYTLGGSGAPANFFMKNGEAFIANDAAGLNTFGVLNKNTNGYSAFIGHQTDPDYPFPSAANNQPYEHFAIGYGAGLQAGGVRGVNYWEISRFTGTNEAKYPPTVGAIQQTGGVDPTGGTSLECTFAANVTTITCPANSLTNGMTVTGANIVPGTTLVSGGGTTSLTLSNPTRSAKDRPVKFSNPVYRQFTPMFFGNCQSPASCDIDFYTWNDTQSFVPDAYSDTRPYMSLDRINGRAYFGRSSIVDRSFATAPLNVASGFPEAFHSVYIGNNTFRMNWAQNPLRLNFIDGNAGAAVFSMMMDGTRRSAAAGPLKLATYTVAGLPACNATYQDHMAIATDVNAPTYRGALTGGGTVRTPVFCDGTSWTAH